MEPQLKHSAIEAYAQNASQNLCDRYFEREETIDGQGILRLAPVKQANLFVLKRLYAKWQEETQKLKSPYFNYQHQDVQQALQEFMNTLSRHICLRREALEPLLSGAIYDTLRLTLAPVTYYTELVQGLAQPTVSLQSLKNEIRYHQLSRPFLEIICQELEESHTENPLAGDLVKRIRSAESTNQWAFSDQDEVLNAFQDIQAFSHDAFFEKAPVRKPDFIKEQEAQPQAKTQKTPTPAAETSSSPLYRQLQNKGPRQTLNELLTEKEEKPNHQPNKHFQNPSGQSLRHSIPLNEKFMFVNELFHGNNLAWGQALETLDNAASYEEALQRINEELAPKFNWNLENDKVNRFVEKIRQKFAA